MQKNIIVIVCISFLLGSIITAGAGYYFIIREDRLTLATVRTELAEYRSRAIDSERRLAESLDIITTGEAKLGGSIATIRDAIQQIQVIRGIISDIKEKLKDNNNHRDNLIGY